MEIQTFFLAEQITQVHGNRHDVRHAAAAYFEVPPDTPFPVRFTIPSLVQLRRESTFGDAPFRLRFDLVDEDGQLVGRPRHFLVNGLFPEGPRFFSIVAMIDLEFPNPGRYRLDVALDEELTEDLFSYNIDIVLRPL